MATINQILNGTPMNNRRLEEDLAEQMQANRLLQLKADLKEYGIISEVSGSTVSAELEKVSCSVDFGKVIVKNEVMFDQFRKAFVKALIRRMKITPFEVQEDLINQQIKTISNEIRIAKEIKNVELISQLIEKRRELRLQLVKLTEDNGNNKTTTQQ